MNNKKWVAFRVDASKKIGSGHVMRCLSLANEFVRRKYDVYFICRDILPALQGLIEDSGYQLKIIPRSDKSEIKYPHSKWLSGTEADDAVLTNSVLSDISKECGRPALVIVDHYALGADWEMAVAINGKILAIDDLNDRKHVSDWLLDQTFGKTEEDYSGLVAENTKLLIGTKYALLRDEFSEKRDEAIKKRDALTEIKNILITMGGVDKDNVTSLILKALNNCDEKYNVTVLLGGGNPNLGKIESLVSKLDYPVSILAQRSDVADLMVDADLCIGAAGSTSWERCVLGLPTINIVLATNQETISKNLGDIGVAINFGKLTKGNLPELSSTINSIANDINKCSSMSFKAFDICDGKGASSVISELLI